jgi:hypothetical protein
MAAVSNRAGTIDSSEGPLGACRPTHSQVSAAMAVIVVPHYEPIKLARWADRGLLERLAAATDNEADNYIVRQAIALDGLHFDLLDGRDQAIRLAERLARVADELRPELLRTPSDDPRDRGFAEVLAELEMRLHDLCE